MPLLMHCLEVLLQITLALVGYHNRIISSRGVLASTACGGEGCRRNKFRESSYQIDDYYRDIATPVVAKVSCQIISVNPNSTISGKSIPGLKPRRSRGQSHPLLRGDRAFFQFWGGRPYGGHTGERPNGGDCMYVCSVLSAEYRLIGYSSQSCSWSPSQRK